LTEPGIPEREVAKPVTVLTH